MPLREDVLIRLLSFRSVVATVIVLAGVYFSSSDVQAKRARAIDDICEAQTHSGVEFRYCVFKLETREGAAVKSGGCGKGACLYRLNKVGLHVYRGSGFELRPAHIDVNLGIIRATLTDPSGASTSFEHSCGAASCPGEAEWTRGAHRGATYREIGEDQDDPSYVILRIPH